MIFFGRSNSSFAEADKIANAKKTSASTYDCLMYGEFIYGYLLLAGFYFLYYFSRDMLGIDSIINSQSPHMRPSKNKIPGPPAY